MYLKNLTALGFKSFADKTSLNFQRGVTAIVGPNGCGKSNISDAVRWVLGEQSAKALRGGEMADVIFNGTDGRKPLGMAEVSLTIGGVDEENLKAAGVEMAYNEVTLTRRVFRDGGSEYFVNQTPCRLKDVQQLFMGTGVGRSSYSIMAQGNITQILSSKPEDRRLVFEEAAGITKFKSQKKEALRKLEYTDQNLLRVSDLIREIKRQIGSLQRQAGKARRYKGLMRELQHLDTQFARHQFDLLQAEVSVRQATLAELRAEMESRSETVRRSENELFQLRGRLSELEREISDARQQGLELKAQSDQHESRIHFNKERLLELEAQHGKALSDIAQAEERRRAAESELASATERLSASNAALDGHRRMLHTRRERMEKLEAELRRQQEALREAQSDAFAFAQQLAQLRNEVTALDLQKQGNVVRLEKLSAEKIQLEEERRRLEARLQEFAANVEAAQLSARTRHGTLEARQRRLAEIEQELHRAGHALAELLRQQAETRSRLNVLEQLQADHEGFGAGSLAALKQSQAVLGSLADRIRVPDQYIAAIESALGHHVQLVLTEQPGTAEQILADLNASGKGRASVAPLAIWRGPEDAVRDPADSPAERPSSESAPAAAEEVLRDDPAFALPARPDSDAAAAFRSAIPAYSVVEADAAVRPLLQRLLGLARIVPDLPTATAAWRECHGAFDFVTLAGELLSRHGVYTGGSGNGSSQAPASILGRKNQIVELQAAAQALAGQIEQASRRKGGWQSEQTELQAGLQQAQTELREEEVAIATRQGEFNALQNSHRALLQKIDTVVYEIQSLAEQAEEGSERRAARVARIGALETREQSRQNEVADLTAGLEGLRQQREAANADLTETKIALATEEQLSASFRQQQQPLEQRIRELGQLADQRRAEIGHFASRKSQWETEIAESRRQVQRLQGEREEVNAQAEELAARQQTAEAESLAREESLRGDRQRLAEAQQQCGALEVELAQKNMAAQHLCERIQQKYQVNLNDVRSECITITFADEGPAQVQILTPEEMAAAGVSTDWVAVAGQVEALQRRIDEMGPVNLVAIEEYEETEQRHQFLTRQHDDLAQAKTQLLEVINRINTQTTQLFTETFGKIRDNFRALFAEVFGGGKADLILVNEGEVLESGIDIVARPPGKQLQSISLLSGGEQTMTAVALLFSIYQVKPSPFCVLDELDAALDESNINRFVRVLQRFLAHSQFILITHNKRTIGMADVLYGVTMQEQGVSKIVSVKFHKADEVVMDHAPAPLEPPSSARPVEEEEDKLQAREETLEVVLAP